MNKIKLNLGCGSVRPAGWINTDSSLNAHLQRVPLIGKKLAKKINNVAYSSHNIIYMNLNKKWKFRDNSVDIVYASHLFEHLTLRSAALFLQESFRCLKPGGVIRIVVPDLNKICRQYLCDYNDASMADPTKFIMWAINMHREGQYGTNLNIFKKVVLEWQGYPHQHKFMYDDRSLLLKIKNAGFVSPYSLTYGESKFISEIKDVEGTKESYLSVYIEAKKPRDINKIV